MPLFEQISRDIMTAMKARDKVRTDALRNIKKYFIEAKTAPGADGELSDEQAVKILSKLSKQGHDTAALYREKGREDLAQEEEAQALVIDEYLPKQLSAEELEAEIRRIVAEEGATSMRDMGKVMGAASKQLVGRADGKAIAALVKQILSA
ncbi:MAG: GatB/YqeY domain-containing protein [Alloprevotella sp.]|nr:GatB/YqeY domain-containing protein [Alloprevotella sp.]